MRARALRRPSHHRGRGILRHIASRLRAVCTAAGLIGFASLAFAVPASAAPLPALTCLAGLCPKSGPTDGPQVPSQGLQSLFAPGGVWNQPLADDAPLDPDSGGLVGALYAAVRNSKAWINTT